MPEQEKVDETTEEEFEDEFEDDTDLDFGDTMEIEGLDDIFIEDTDNIDEEEEEEDDDTEVSESEAQTAEKPEGQDVDYQARYAERMEQELTTLRAEVAAMRQDKTTQEAVPDKSIDEVVGELLEDFKVSREQMKEKTPDDDLDPEQERAYAYAIGQHLTKRMLEYVDKTYGKPMKDLLSAYQERARREWNSSLRRAQNRFFEAHPEVKKNTPLFNELDRRIANDPKFRELQLSPDEDELLDLFEEKYSVRALKDRQKVEQTTKRTKEKRKRVRQREASDIRDISSGTSTTVKQKVRKPKDMRESIAEDFRRFGRVRRRRTG